jgi:UDP-N-acetylmuramyl pentapeptide phosphotransferase/UDP-N-acetylglucosamine-1-phosphate transferase
MNPVLAQWLAVVSPLLAFGVALLVLPWLLGPGRRWMPVDHPNERSLHHTPTPRSGGIAILAGTLAGLAAGRVARQRRGGARRGVAGR